MPIGSTSEAGITEEGSGMEATLVSSIPSAKLEQDAHMFGFRESTLPGSTMGSPQQMQMLGFIGAIGLRAT